MKKMTKNANNNNKKERQKKEWVKGEPSLQKIINYVIFRSVVVGFKQLATLEFETKQQKCIRKGITILRILVWRGIALDIHSEIMFNG